MPTPSDFEEESDRIAAENALKYMGLEAGTPMRDVHVDTVSIKYGGRSVVAPVWITPGQPDGVVTVHLGYGRTRAGRAGSGLGFNAYAIRAADSPWHGVRVSIRLRIRRFYCVNEECAPHLR